MVMRLSRDAVPLVYWFGEDSVSEAYPARLSRFEILVCVVHPLVGSLVQLKSEGVYLLSFGLFSLLYIVKRWRVFGSPP